MAPRFTEQDVGQKSERPEDVPPDPPRPRGERPVSFAGLRALARVRREVPVDLRLDTDELRCAEDIRALLEACDTEARRREVPPPKTLTFGPWGHDLGCACHGISDVAVLPREEAACDTTVESAIEAFLSTCPIWSAWPLRSLCLCELRVSKMDGLGEALAAAGAKVLRLQHLALGSALASLLQAFAGCELELLDLSGNNLTDADFEMFLKMAGASSPLKLQGLVLSGNPSITQVSLEQLCASPWGDQLQHLDLSQCSIGPAGAMLLETFLRSSHRLRELCLYRTGIGSEGVRRLAAAAANSPSLRALDVTANAQHGDDWMEVLGRPLAHCLAEAKCLKIVTLSCPENQLKAAEIFQSLPLRVILVPNEQNNYNRPMFLGHAD